MEIVPGVSMDPNVRFGWPYLTGTRVDVATVVGALSAGESFEGVQEAYLITRDQILTALRYAAHVAEHVPPAVEQAEELKSGSVLSNALWCTQARKICSICWSPDRLFLGKCERYDDASAIACQRPPRPA
jgi:uncharacterized protein (DUF433 family)